MASKAGLYIIVAILVVGVAGPAASFLLPQAEPEPAPTPSEPQPVTPTYTQVQIFTAELYSKLVFLEPVMGMRAVSDNGATSQIRETLEAMPGVEEVDISQSLNTAGNELYAYDISLTLEDQSFLAQTSYFISKDLPDLQFSQISTPGTVELPESFDAVSNIGKPQTITLSNTTANALVFPHSTLGEDIFIDLRVTFSQNVLSKVEIYQKLTTYNPPTESFELSTTAEVTSLDKVGLYSRIPYGEDIDIESFDAKYSAIFTPATDFVSVKPISLKPLLEENNFSLIEIEDTLFVFFEEDYAPTIAEILALAPDAEVEEPHGVLQVEAVHGESLPEVPGTISKTYTIATLELPSTIGDFDVTGFTEISTQLPTTTELGSTEVTIKITTAFNRIDSVEIIS